MLPLVVPPDLRAQPYGGEEAVGCPLLAVGPVDQPARLSVESKEKEAVVDSEPAGSSGPVHEKAKGPFVAGTVSESSLVCPAIAFSWPHRAAVGEA